jgi:hypothetical protein
MEAFLFWCYNNLIEMKPSRFHIFWFHYWDLEPIFTFVDESRCNRRKMSHYKLLGKGVTICVACDNYDHISIKCEINPIS